MDKKAQAIKLREQGWFYKDIGKELGVSATMARNYVHGDKYARATAESRENAPYTCNKVRPGYEDRCMRHASHDGVHLSDKLGKLIWWE